MMISDETLSAFLDNELSEQQLADVSDQLKQDAALNARLEVMRQHQLALQNAFQTLPESLVEKRLQRQLLEGDYRASRDRGEAQYSAPKESTLVDFPSKPQPSIDKPRRWQPWTATAAVAACVLSALWFVGREPEYSATVLPLIAGALPNHSSLANVLTTQASGPSQLVDPAHDHSTQVITVHLTFVRDNGQVCREFEVQWTEREKAQRGQRQAAVACRAQSQWQVVLTQTPQSVHESDHGVFETASGGDDHAYDDHIDVLMEDNEPLSGVEEKALMLKAWKTDSTH